MTLEVLPVKRVFFSKQCPEGDILQFLKIFLAIDISSYHALEMDVWSVKDIGNIHQEVLIVKIWIG